MHDAYRQRETALATAMEDRTDWERATRQQRQLAVAADAELRRRHPQEPWPPLRSAEPEPEPEPAPESGATPVDMTATVRLIDDMAARHRELTAKLADRQSIMTPADDPDYDNLTQAFPDWTPTRRDAILQPPKPQITPSAPILELTAERDRDMEPGG
jgi:hypothetical protein